MASSSIFAAFDLFLHFIRKLPVKFVVLKKSVHFSSSFSRSCAFYNSTPVIAFEADTPNPVFQASCQFPLSSAGKLRAA
jgi:hypothetical protein